MNGQPALFGGRPLFSSPRPVGQLAAPPIESYLRLLRQAYDSRALRTGPIAASLERELAAFHGVRHCLVFVNAGFALTMLMRHYAAGRHGNVIMPAFTFRGLPHFARWAGQVPRFCDVEPNTHGLDPKSAAAAIDEDTVAILAVNNVHSASDIDALCALAGERRLPILFDSVYALGATYGGHVLGRFGNAEVYSMHATKLLNGFEGGYVTTDDDALYSALRRYRDGGRVNANLNEMHAAMATLCLQELPKVIASNAQRYRRYRSALASVPGLKLLEYRNEDIERYNYEMALLEITGEWPLTRDETIKLLRAEGAIISTYYSPPLHRLPQAPAGVPVPELPVTENLAARFLQLPVGELMSLDDIDALAAYLKRLSRNGDEVALRLREMKA